MIEIKVKSDSGIVDHYTTYDVDSAAKFLAETFDGMEISVSNGERKQVTITVDIT